MKPTQAAGLITVILCLQATASAADWSFCIAPADADHRIFISRPFPSIGPTAEAEFDVSLARRHLNHEPVQCPRADDEEGAIVMREHAAEVNRQWGRQVVDIPWRAGP